jgi:hypothetical protein
LKSFKREKRQESELRPRRPAVDFCEERAVRLSRGAFRILTVVAFVLCFSAGVSAESNSSVCDQPGHRVDSISKDSSSIDVTDCSSGEHAQLLVKDSALQERVKTLQSGDIVDLAFDSNSKALQTISIRTADVSVRARFLVLGASAVALLLLSMILTLLHPLRLIVGEDGRYSNSKFQIALWFGILLTTYLAAAWLRVSAIGWNFLGGINIPTNLLLISGVSVFTFGAAKGITTEKVRDAIAAGDPDPKSQTQSANFLLDLTHDDGKNGDATPKFDLGDFQMLVITLVAAGMYLVVVFHFLGTLEMRKVSSLPDVDTTILAAFGLGQGAYLTKKALGEVGKS